MSRLTGTDAYGLMEAYGAVYAPQELTEEQVWEEVETWVNSLLEEGYDLSDYTWEEMYESYLEEKEGMDVFKAIRDANSKPSTIFTKPVQKAPPLGQPGSGFQDRRPFLGMPSNNSLTLPPNRVGPGLVGGKVGPKIVGPKIVGPKIVGTGKVDTGAAPAAPAITTTPAPRSSAAGTPADSKVAPTKPAATAQTGDKTKDMATFAKANPNLAAAAAEKARIRGTQQTDNPLMKSMRSRLPMNSPSVQAPAVAGLGKGNQSLSQNPNAFKAAPPKPAATSTAPEVKATNTIAAKTAPTPVIPKQTPRQARLNMEEYDTFDTVLEHLIAEGYADTEESALAIMTNMSEEWRESILNEGDNYDKNRQRAAKRAAERNAARDRGQTGNVPGVGYVTPRRERETYRDSAGTERHTSGAKMPKKEG